MPIAEAPVAALGVPPGQTASRPGRVVPRNRPGSQVGPEVSCLQDLNVGGRVGDRGQLHGAAEEVAVVGEVHGAMVLPGRRLVVLDGHPTIRLTGGYIRPVITVSRERRGRTYPDLLVLEVGHDRGAPGDVRSVRRVE